MTPPLLLHTFRLTALLSAAMLFGGCEDPEREARLQWREEEVDAKEVAMVRREREVLQQQQEIDGLRLELAKRETEIQRLKMELEEEVEKMKEARVAFENQKLRGTVPSITADRVIVINPENGEVLFEKNADKEAPVASTQKLLTAMLVIEGGPLDQIVTVTKDDTNCPPVRLGIQEGEQYTRRQLVTALLVKSSNDIAQALARDVSGSMEAFVAAMNARAKALGCENSMFRNPHGLPSDPPQYSTARDLSKIAIVADQIPEIRDMVTTEVFKFEREGKSTLTLENTNRVMRRNSYCDGMKTGYTNAAGYCLVATGEKNGKRRIVVVLNGSKYKVWDDAENLLMWALKA